MCRRLWRISGDYDACVVRVSNIITSARGVRGEFSPGDAKGKPESRQKESTLGSRSDVERKRREDVFISNFKFNLNAKCVVKRGIDKK